MFLCTRRVIVKNERLCKMMNDVTKIEIKCGSAFVLSQKGGAIRFNLQKDFYADIIYFPDRNTRAEE